MKFNPRKTGVATLVMITGMNLHAATVIVFAAASLTDSLKQIAAG